MTLEEMKQIQWSVSWSGGKDSTTTIILMHENGIPIKEIVYARMMFDDETPATLPVMTNFVDYASSVFKSWGYEVKIVKSVKPATDIVNKKYQKSKFQERNGKPYGITQFSRKNCMFQGVKQKTCEMAIDKDAYQMIGYACDETDRLSRLNEKKQSIMAVLGVKESDTFDICKKYNLLSPLYELGLKRDGCWFCPNAAKKEREYIKRNYPELVEKINWMITMCDYDLTPVVGRNTWLQDYVKNNGDLTKLPPEQISMW